jgi:hypothetical protein
MIGCEMSGVAGLHSPRLHLVYRSHGGENRKARPGYYSKLLALMSFVRAVEQVAASCSVVFVNDGPVPDERLKVMREFGRVRQGRFGSNRASYRAAVSLATMLPAAASDLVWLGEDDYLYRPDSLRHLLAAAGEVPEGDYFSLYSPADLDAGRSRGVGLPWRPSVPRATVSLGGLTWFSAVSTTSTFAVRSDVLRQDRHLLRTAPYTGGAWDHTTSVAVQGATPFSAESIRRDLAPFRAEPAGQWPRSIVRGTTRLAMNQRARRRPERRRSFYASDPLLILHLETIEDGRVFAPDWVDLADETRAWALQRGVRVGAV